MELPAAATAREFRVRLLGSFAVYRDGRPLDTSGWHRSVVTFLKLLATGHQWSRSRDEVMEILWPDAAPEAAASNLRSQLHRLRQALGGDPWPVLYERGWIRLNRFYRWDIDLNRFEELLRTAGEDIERLRAAVQLYEGEPLLEDRYTDWAAPVRDRAEREWRGAVLRLAGLLEKAGQHDDAISRLEGLMEADPFDEETFRALIRSLAAAGKRTDAIRRYGDFERRLREQLELDPEPETMELAVQIKERSEPVRRAVRRDAEALPEPSIHPTNLPHPLTSFIGRGREVEEIVRLVASPEVRLLTLTGAGGIGKTRLAQQVGRALLPDFEDGVHFASLVRITDPQLVVSAVAATLGIKQMPGESLQGTLTSYLRHKRMVLILDNFEHVLPAAVEVAELLEACAYLRALTTSREPLHVYGEHQFPVPPLKLPDPALLPEVGALRQWEAVDLFVQRASAVRPSFALNAANASAVVDICRRLDGLPLAIELAAARVKILSPPALLARLDRRLPVLSAGPRNVSARHQSVRAAIDWSFNLLDEAEQRRFLWLSVFVGGFTLEGAEAIEAGDDPGATLNGMTSLVEKSLIRQDLDVTEEPHFTMLETIREYAVERLEERGEGDEVRRRHTRYYVSLAERAESGLWGPEQAMWFKRLEAETGNLRKALDWAVEHDELELALRILGELWRFWIWQGDHTEWRRRLDFVLERSIGVSQAVRANALFAGGWLALQQGEPEAARTFGEEELEIARRLKDPLGVRHALSILGMAARQRGEPRDAVPLFRETVAITRTQGYSRYLPPSLFNLGMALVEMGETDEGIGAIEEALLLFHRQGEKYIALTAMRTLAWILLSQGDVERPAQLFRASLALCIETAHRTGIAESLEGIAAVYAERGRALEAARLLGAVHALRDRIAQPILGVGRVDRVAVEFDLNHYRDMIRRRLGDAGWKTAWQAGQEAPLEQGINLAMQGS